MINFDFYSAILGLSSNWAISRISEDKTSRLPVVHINSVENDYITCDCCGKSLVISGFSSRSMLYTSTLNIRLHVSVEAPVADCPTCGRQRVAVPWSSAECDENEIVL